MGQTTNKEKSETVKRLSLNSELHELLKLKYRMGLSALPIVFVIGFILLLYFPGIAYYHIMELPLDTPFGETGISFTVILIALICSITGGFFFGWFCNRLVCKYWLGWSSDKIRRVFFHSEVPDHWYKSGGKEQQRMALIEQSSFWEGFEPKSLIVKMTIRLLLISIPTILMIGIILPFIAGSPYPDLNQWLKYIAIVLSIVFLLVVGISFIVYRNYRQSNREVETREGDELQQADVTEEIIKSLPEHPMSTWQYIQGMAYAMLILSFCGLFVLWFICFVGNSSRLYQ